jgi:plasmid stabilization system protein ParE
MARWDAVQAAKYIGGLEAMCQELADGHGVGRKCDDISPGLWPVDYMSHIVFYRRRPWGLKTFGS